MPRHGDVWKFKRTDTRKTVVYAFHYEGMTYVRSSHMHRWFNETGRTPKNNVYKLVKDGESYPAIFRSRRTPARMYTAYMAKLLEGEV